MSRVYSDQTPTPYAFLALRLDELHAELAIDSELAADYQWRSLFAIAKFEGRFVHSRHLIDGVLQEFCVRMEVPWEKRALGLKK